MREIGVMAAHMHAEAMTAEKAPLSEKTKRRAACHSEIRTRREQASESMWGLLIQILKPTCTAGW